MVWLVALQSLIFLKFWQLLMALVMHSSQRKIIPHGQFVTLVLKQVIDLVFDPIKALSLFLQFNLGQKKIIRRIIFMERLRVHTLFEALGFQMDCQVSFNPEWLVGSFAYIFVQLPFLDRFLPFYLFTLKELHLIKNQNLHPLLHHFIFPE